ncbi:mechanosensitive ion channel family protein [Leucothrix pacifica]|uniref:Small-conductance mechanosensitive channel n=1 Tax=Leucothrix pacifica TaxID=1247513 RepID=A0A317CN02_9GAMM|nr:mechanosensitive ion channel family protein [Leucothrix pacifica]PWQ99689.1 mechanosensitive ion channel protein MscS [Leucothrix pacifica]
MKRIFCLLLMLWMPLSHADDLTDLLTGGAKEEAVVADKVITTDSSKKEDDKIAQRLREIYAELDDLQGVSIAVNKGVVTLTGEVSSSADESKALQFAGQVEGVVEVENELTVSRSLKKRLVTTGDKLWSLTKQTTEGLPLFLIAILVIVLFWILGGWLSKRRFYRKITPNQFIANLLGQISHLIFIILGLVLALILLDATALIGTILGAAGIIGLAVGFAVRDTVENYIASILLSLRNPFQVNDFVSIDGHQGNVLRLTSRATILITPDGNHIRIPNAMVFKAVITNFTRHSERRFQFDVGIDTDQDLLEAQALAMKTVKATEGVLDDPKPLVVIEALGDSNVLLRIYGWLNQEQYSYAKVRSETIRMVKQAFDEAGIVMPEPIYKLRMMQTGGTTMPSLPQRNTVEQTAPSETQTRRTETISRAKIMADDVDTQDVQDVTPDRTVENLVIEEQLDSNEGENLLTESGPKE